MNSQGSREPHLAGIFHTRRPKPGAPGEGVTGGGVGSEKSDSNRLPLMVDPQAGSQGGEPISTVLSA